ncbi:SNF2-related protein [Burkholderia pseudomallei]|nr:SNF2-related protein [Burkholderia pseudomallei]CAJ6703833.1 SNF2-related protein [Burkholderia pseudomallei]
MKNDLPPYLLLPEHKTEPLGVLEKIKGPHGSLWQVTGDPQMVTMAKRLFPASEGRGAGIAKFPVNQRLFGDLVWFLHRYPLDIVSKDEFLADYERSCSFVLKRQEILAHPVTRNPDVLFTGELRQFQQEGLDWILTNKRTLLADDMGLGKTVTASAVIATDPAWPVLVTPPPHLVKHWEAFLARFLDVQDNSAGPLFSDGKLIVHVIRGTNRKKEPLPPAHIYICHYLLLRHWRQELAAAGLKKVIFDEAQELRHAGTEKYSAASELASIAEIVLALSGTPIYGRGGEMWNVMNVVDYHCLGDWDTFTREWCAGYGSDVVKDPELLNATLRRDGLMLRRRKEEVAAQLPAKERIVESVDSDQGIFAKFVTEAVRLAKSAKASPDRFERGRLQMQAIELTRRATGVAKAPAVAAFVRGMLEAGEPTVVFAHHHDVVDYLQAELADFRPVLITGRQTEDQKWIAKESFIKGESLLCIVALRAATGIDGLQSRARVAVFAELDWSPAIHKQAEDRLHRDGQMNPVLCYYLVSDAGVDPDMLENLGAKAQQFIGLMGDTPETATARELSETNARKHMQNVLAKLVGSVDDAIAAADIDALVAC